jgi:hypothetical protein
MAASSSPTGSPYPWQRGSNTSPSSSSRRWTIAVALVSVAALSYFAHSSSSSAYVPYTPSSELAVTRTAPSNPDEPCKRTLVLDWGAFTASSSFLTPS